VAQSQARISHWVIEKLSEVLMRQSLIKSDIDARELKRAIAVRMAISGNIYNESSKILGVSNFFIGYWKKQFKTKGIAGIKLGHKGSKGYLTDLQNTEVIDWLKVRIQVKKTSVAKAGKINE
jgi:putative transposase